MIRWLLSLLHRRREHVPRATRFLEAPEPRKHETACLVCVVAKVDGYRTCEGCRTS